LFIYGVDGGKTVQYPALLLDGVDEGRQREVSAHDAVVCLPGIILNFLYKHNVWSVQVLRNVIGDGREVTRSRGQVLHLADANEQRTEQPPSRAHIIVTDGNNVPFLRGFNG